MTGRESAEQFFFYYKWRKLKKMLWGLRSVIFVQKSVPSLLLSFESPICNCFVNLGDDDGSVLYVPLSLARQLFDAGLLGLIFS
jgi:hypothetical protein